MALTAPVLQGTTLPDCFDFSFAADLRYVATEMADGTIVYDFISSTRKRTWVLEWRGLTNTEIAAILDAYDELLTGPTSDNFVDPKGNTYTVGRPQNAQAPEVTHVKGTGHRDEPLYNVTIRLREI